MTTLKKTGSPQSKVATRHPEWCVLNVSCGCNCLNCANSTPNHSAGEIPLTKLENAQVRVEFEMNLSGTPTEA